MDTNAIKAFISVAENMSVTKASKKLFLTQPAVSRRIARLEEELGVRLFDRANKRMFLTLPGEKLLVRCKQILSDIDFAAREASHLGNEVIGHLAVGMSHHVSLYRAPKNLKRYQDLYPDVELDLNFLTSEDAIDLVSRGKLELAMVTLPPKALPNLEFIPIWRDELYIALPNNEEYLNADLKELAKKPVILPHDVSTTRKNIDNIFRNHNLSFTHITETSNFEVISKMIETGLGWSVLPSHMMNDEIVRAFTDSFVAIRTQGIVLHSQRQLSLASEALVNLMVDQLSNSSGSSNRKLEP
ncbi:MAG: LysR family transcriptional regulator [Acidiferrobacterales bacterium]|nr:LysR family transcriptional regulator [Acidiferrobacterales bacterium]